MVRYWRVGVLLVGVLVVAFVLSYTVHSLLLPRPVSSSATAIARQTPSPSGIVRQPTPTSTPTPTPTPVNTTPVQVSSDPYTSGGGQHKTEVEPATFAYGSTIVAAYQAGRFRDVGSTNIGWATSSDAGVTWQHGFLSGTTKVAGGPYDRITDPAVAYDARHATWMIATVVFTQTANGISAPAVLVSLSTDGGLSWGHPITVANEGIGGGMDKDWVICDNTPGSPFYGNCYIQWDDYTRNDLVLMSTSSDGGHSWGAAKTTANQASGTSGYPLVQPNGTVIVPISSGNERDLLVYSSHNGGNSWSSTSFITAVTSYAANAYFTDNILLAPATDGSGKVYLVWVDCRFETSCRNNDLAMTTSTDGVSWSPVQRIPLTPAASGINYYVTGLAIDGNTTGATAHLALLFYYYDAHCSNNCLLSVGFSYSTNGGSSWSLRKTLAGPFSAAWIASGNNKVGDYTAISFVQGKAVPFFASAIMPGLGSLDEGMYTIPGGISLS